MQSSKIEWTDATWNPWHGCTKVSPGCDNCYMYRDKIRYGQNPEIVVRSKTTFTAPLGWKEPRNIFTCSWSDFFIKDADEWRQEAWDIINNTPHHTYQILTKRPARVKDDIPDHCWLGVSVENKKHGIPRIRVLQNLQIENKHKFLSIEPLLEDLGKLDLSGIDWVIVGGESGSDARTMDSQWAINIKEQCEEQNVRFFMKQLSQADTKYFKEFNLFDEVLRIRQMPP